jgi:hypothetical protein
MTGLFLTYFLYLQVDSVFSFVNLKMVFFDFWVHIIPLARKDVDVNEHVRLSNFTPRHKLK